MGKKFDQEIIFILFSVFNAILGLSGIAVIGGGIYLVVKLEFNQYIVIIIGLGIGIIITTIFVIGLFTRKRDKVLFIYIILIIIIFLLEVAVDMIIKFHEETNTFIKESIKELIDLTEEKKDEIVNVSVIIIGIAAACSGLSCVFGLVYYLKLKKIARKWLEDIKKGDEFIKGLDYTNLNPDMSGI